MPVDTSVEERVGSVFVHVIDATDTIVHVDEQWAGFARRHGLDIDSIVGESLWSHVTGVDARELSRSLLARARACGESLKFPFRCDAADRRRFMEMVITPVDDAWVRYECSVVKLERREPAVLFEEEVDRSDELVTVCSWCKKIKVADDQWGEVEEAVVTLGLFAASTVPGLTHGVCPTCFEVLVKDLPEG